METDLMKEEMLNDAHSLLDSAEKLATANEKLRKREQELLDQIEKAGGFNVSTPEWIEFDENVEEKRPKDGEFVVVQVGNCQPYMLTYLKGCKIKINKWFRLPEW